MFGKKNDLQADTNMYIIHDTKAGNYDFPIYSLNDETMRREIFNLMASPDSEKSKYYVNAEDYAIFRLCSFDRGLGIIHNTERQHVANLIDIKAAALHKNKV